MAENKFVDLDSAVPDLLEEIEEKFEAQIEYCRENSEDAKFRKTYVTFRSKMREHERQFARDNNLDLYAERMEREFSTMWERYSDSAFYHPPYVVPCDEDSFVSLLRPNEENPCIDGEITLQDTLTWMFRHTPAGIDREFEPTLWVNERRVTDAGGNSHTGPPQDVTTVGEILLQFGNFYDENGLTRRNGTLAGIDKFKNYFNKEHKIRAKLTNKRVALLEAQKEWQITISQIDTKKSSQAAARTLGAAESVVEAAAAAPAEEEEEVGAVSFSSNLAKDFQMEQAQDALEVKRMKLGTDREALSAFRSSDGYREWEARRRAETTQVKMVYQNKRERLIMRFSEGGLTIKLKNSIAEQLQEAEDERDADMRDLREDFDEEKNNLLQNWGSDPAESNGGALAPTASQISRAQTLQQAAQDLAAVVSDGVSFAGGAGGRTDKGRSSRIQEKKQRDEIPQMSKADYATMQTTRIQMKIREGQARRQAEINQWTTRLGAARTFLQNTKRDRDQIKWSLGVARPRLTTKEADEFKKKIKYRLDRIQDKIMAYEADIIVFTDKIEKLRAKVPAKKRSLFDDSDTDSESDKEENTGAGRLRQKRQKRGAVPKKSSVEKPSVERLTATFGTHAEITLETPPAVATLTTAKPPAVMKKKRRSRPRKKTGLSTGKTEASLKPSNLIF